MTIWPPSGMASRAFTARLSSAISSWLASAQYRAEHQRKARLDADRGAERALQQVGHAAHEVGHIDRVVLELLAAGEGKHALGQRRAALRALHGVVEQRQ